jgi:N-acetylmuramoyl-L-alanine amidase
MHRLSLLLLVVMLGSCVPIPLASAQQDPRFFPQTGYRIAEDSFWFYFQRRGGVRVFGYPVSNAFSLLGFRVQIFQREILQLLPDGSATMMNVLDDGLMLYTRINGSTFPGLDPEVIGRQPTVGAADYHVKALQFVRENAPDEWQGMKVNFYQTFANSVRFEDAFPDGRGDRGLLPGFNLEVWGLPTSKPAFDPNNAGFVYLRFQRGIMHFDSATGATQGLLLADYVKSLLTLANLPGDLADQARQSRLYGQLDSRAAQWLRRPAELPGSDLVGAFDIPSDVTAAGRPPAAVPSSPPFSPAKGQPTVLVDAGHGGKEIGASYRFEDGVQLLEKSLNLRVATKVSEELRQSGVAAIMSRSTDAPVNGSTDLNGDDQVGLTDDLQARVDLANKSRAHLIVSVHFNGVTDSTKRGTQVFFADGRTFSDRSRFLAELTQAQLVKQLKAAGYETVDRKATADSRVLGSGSHYYLLGPESETVRRPSQMPGIIGEGLFVTNEEDAKALRQEKTLDAIARAYAEAVKAYFQKYPTT